MHLPPILKSSDAILRENYHCILAAENVIDTMERQDSAGLPLLLGYREKGLAQFQSNGIEFLQWPARAKDNVTIGLSVGVTSPGAPAGVLLTQIVGMILGRLEFFTLIVGVSKVFSDVRIFLSADAGGA